MWCDAPPHLCYNFSVSNLTMSLAPPTPQTPGVPDWMSGDDPTPAAGSFATVEPPRGSAAAPSLYDAPVYTTSRTTYRPTAEQLARDELRHAYWRRNVRLPLVIAVLLVAALFVTLVVLAFAGPWLGFDTAAARSFISGLSGLTIILIALPLTALMALLPLAYAAWWFNRRHNRKLYPETGPMAYRGRLQTLLWQLDSLLDRARRTTTRGGARVTRPLIGLHARGGYWQQFVRAARRNFGRGLD